MTKLRFTENTPVVVKGTKKTGVVSATTSIRTGGQGRPRTVITVRHDDGEAEYGARELRPLALGVTESPDPITPYMS